MSSESYTLVPGKGPSIDRLADSWKYRNHPTTIVTVEFTGIRESHEPDDPQRRTIETQVHELAHMSSSWVRVTMYVSTDRRSQFYDVKYVVYYNYQTRNGIMEVENMDEPIAMF